MSDRPRRRPRRRRRRRDRPSGAVLTPAVGIDLIDRVRDRLRDVVSAARAWPHLVHADLRLEAIEARSATAENGSARGASDDYALALGVRVLAGERMVGAGYAGRALGASDVARLPEIAGEALGRAYHRARINGEMKADAREKFGALGEALADTRLHPVRAVEATVPAVYAIDPRSVDLGAMVRYTADVSRRVAAVGPALAYNYVSTLTQLSRELYVSSDGAAIDQTFALTQGACWIVATGSGAGRGAETSQEVFDVLGHQRGWEILDGGIDDPLMRFPPFVDFALEAARETVALAAAPPLPTMDREAVVVTDPHYNALLSHEIVGHPVELDRALKMETAYAGRSWLFGGPDDHQLGRQIASPLVTAYSDPALPGYGHYAYDHEGTPARRVVHIDRGVFTGFMNSRQTAAVFGGEPNGHWKATDMSLVPLIRMSNTVFAQGRDPAGDIVRDVEHGFYLVGHRTPSIAESRENFRISARKVYEIDHGRLGRLYRDGGIAADSRDFLMNVDAVGDDFRLYPIPNCGKGQPMQTKRLGNGGPTLRSRARLTGA